ncbi:ExbD/TolR family protein [Methylolobus aquaticus]
MNFRARTPDHPELNLIPMIDVLIVLLIFLVLTTTFRRETGLKVRLPQSATPATTQNTGIGVTIDRDGRVEVDGVAAKDPEMSTLKALLASAASGDRTAVVVRADRQTPHESVMRVLDAASQVGLGQISFMLESNGTSPGPAPRGHDAR